jgi:N-acetylneuraminate synthase
VSAFVVAEAGVNHNGSTELAMRLVEVAADAGADAVKFQTFRAEALATAGAGKAAYQERTTGPGSQLAMLKSLELDADAHRALLQHCAERGIEFMSSPFDPESLDLLVRLGVRRLKLGSGELTNGPLLKRAAESGLPLIVSTGMATLDEVADALALLRRAGALDITLLQCTTEYPASPADANLRAMATLRDRFGVRVGYSDHTTGTAVAVAAVALGAAVIEKHFTLDRSMPGPDHEASLEPRELAELVAAIRSVESALGDGAKRPMEAELANRSIARRSLVAAVGIRRGEMFSEQNVAAKRPGTGISPMRHWDLIGVPASRDYSPDDLIDPAELIR